MADPEEDTACGIGCLLSDPEEIWYTTGDVDEPDWDEEGGEILR